MKIRMQTIADGIGVRVPVPEALADLRGLVDDALLVRDETIIRGMRLIHRHAGWLRSRLGQSASPRCSNSPLYTDRSDQ